MKRLIKLLFLTTLLVPPVAGMVAVFSGFHDTWGMGSKDPVGIFVMAALPLLPPGMYQWVAWPLTYGVAMLLSPLALLRMRNVYAMVMLTYLAVVAGGWLLGWLLNPVLLNEFFGYQTFQAGQLSNRLWEFGILLLTDAAVLAVTVSWWRWRGDRAHVGDMIWAYDKGAQP